jgi:hypothetical protein
VVGGGIVIPAFGSNVSGTAPGKDAGGGEFFTDLAFVNEPEPVVAEPEPSRRVKVLAPFLVAHEGIRWYPDEVAEVPESVALHWRSSGWVLMLDEGVTSVPVEKAGRRASRPK